MLKPEIILDVGVNYYELAEKNGTRPVLAAAGMIDEISQLSFSPVVKFQWYGAEQLAKETAEPYWDTSEEKTQRQIDLFRKYDSLDADDFDYLKRICDKHNLEFMCTAFDKDRLEAINPLVKRHKIASADITNYELLKQVSSYNKPVILSTGASTELEIEDALRVLGPIPVTLLHCILNYPQKDNESHLWKIEYMRKKFPQCKVGYSCHARYNPNLLIAAWMLGAKVIEKHYSNIPDAKGNDHYHAINFSNCENMTFWFDKYFDMIGSRLDGFTLCLHEQVRARTHARRGVYLKRDVEKGKLLSFEDVEFLRPQLNKMTPMDFATHVKEGIYYGENFKAGEQL